MARRQAKEGEHEHGGEFDHAHERHDRWVDEVDAALKSAFQDAGAAMARQSKAMEADSKIFGRHFLKAQQEILKGMMAVVENNLERLDKPERPQSERIKVD